MQWRMLGRRGEMASWTIVGDAAQSAWPDLAEARRAREEALRGKQVRRFHLGTNYRNSAEIFEFAASVVRRAVPDADLPDAVRRTGIEPEHRTVPAGALAGPVAGPVAGSLAGSVAVSVADEVKRLRDLVDGTIGVITPVARQAEIAAAVAEPSDRRVLVVDAMRAKGLEYDAVVVVAPDEIAAESPAGVRVLYVALTRATHRLVTIATRPWPSDVAAGAPL